MKKILKPTKINLISNIFLSLMLILLMIFLPSSGIRDTFAQISIGQKLLSFFVSYVFSYIIYYPLTSGIIYLINAIKKSDYKIKEIILAVVFILIFNPITIAFIVSLFSVKVVAPNDQSRQTTKTEVKGSEIICGLTINGFTPNSKASEAGLTLGENILTLDGAQIKVLQDIFDALENKKPGDKISLETDKGIKTVELVANVRDTNKSALGVVLISKPCE